MKNLSRTRLSAVLTPIATSMRGRRLTQNSINLPGYVASPHSDTSSQVWVPVRAKIDGSVDFRWIPVMKKLHLLIPRLHDFQCHRTRCRTMDQNGPSPQLAGPTFGPPCQACSQWLVSHSSIACLLCVQVVDPETASVPITVTALVNSVTRIDALAHQLDAEV